MSPYRDQSDNADEPRLPGALQAELRRAYGHTPAVPPGVDAAILNDARAGFARRRRFRLAVRGGLAAAAAAAALALALIIPALMKSDARQQAASPAPVATQMLSVAPPAGEPEDVDHSGRVDILDALVVAKLVDARQQIDKAYDVNGDGTVDHRDVDRIATLAVDTSSSATSASRPSATRVQ